MPGCWEMLAQHRLQRHHPSPMLIQERVVLFCCHGVAAHHSLPPMVFKDTKQRTERDSTTYFPMRLHDGLFHQVCPGRIWRCVAVLRYNVRIQSPLGASLCHSARCIVLFPSFDHPNHISNCSMVSRLGIQSQDSLCKLDAMLLL
jgi:hypothetical protein